MAPSHATLRIAPYADPDFIASHISFWNNVYGFKMDSMLHKIYDEAVVRSNQPDTIVGESQIFLTLPLHTITVEELSFLKEFQVDLEPGHRRIGRMGYLVRHLLHALQPVCSP